MKPEAAMRMALAQARRASGRTFPNPPVGAVVYRQDRVLGRGYTRPVGGPHAEVVALGNALRKHGARAVRGASIAVTLEPCNHRGRTDPCVDLLIDSGVRRVFFGHIDPHRDVAGRGARRLRHAGLEVTRGVMEAECREQHRGFIRVCESRRPWLALKLASTLDGRIATAGGESRWITGPASRAAVHRLRGRVDAVMVGSGTALADDPELSARKGRRIVHRPVRVLVDSKLRVSPRARLHRLDSGRSWVLAAASAPAARRRALEAAGVRVLDVPLREGQIDLKRALGILAREGLTEILVEGGGELGAALLRRSLVDELHWFAAGRLLGGDARPALGPLGLRSLAASIDLSDVRLRRVGEDLHWSGQLAGRQRRSRGKP